MASATPCARGLRPRLDAARVTVLAFGRGDAIRAQTEECRGGLHAFRPTEGGDRLRGCGTADRKGRHRVDIAKMKAVPVPRGLLGFDIMVEREMSAEAGSHGRAASLGANRHRLSADMPIASDGPRPRPDTPTMFMGPRGAMTLDPVSAHSSDALRRMAGPFRDTGEAPSPRGSPA